MSDPNPRDKVEDKSQRDIKKTPEYRKFQKLLKQVIKAPPMPRKRGDIRDLNIPIRQGNT
jgi:hypothetical protein